MKEITNRYTIALLSVIAVLALVAFSTPAMADSCICNVSTSGAGSYGTNGTVKGTVYVGGGDMAEGDPWNPYMEFDVPSGKVKWARVYWHIWGGTPGGYGWTNATFCNDTQCFTDNQSIPALVDTEDNCNHTEYHGFYMGGCGTHWVYWNVTNNVTAGAKNNLTLVHDHVTWDGRVMYMVLVVVLENNAYPYTNYWINQGYEDLEPPGESSTGNSTTWFNGTINNTVNSTLTHLALCSNGELSILFNNKLVNNYPYGTVEEPTVEDINKSWIENDNTQNMTWYDIGDDWLHPVMAILIDNKTTLSDLTITGIEFPTVMRPNTNHMINATIKNQGKGNASGFNVSLYVNDLENSTKQTVSSLNASESTTVSFTNVNLPEGCYTFKVVADSDGDETEADETNNASSKKNQVGYVVVVKSDSDFEKLNTLGDYALPTDCFKNESGIYYIQNLTGSRSITNCMGNGITIENTNKKFVINNCTVKNCKGSGVFFHNLTNGTVSGSIMQNNSKYGIELGLVPLSAEDPKFVNITNSTILENKLSGIELIGRDFIVYNNTVRNNSQQGIYLFANDTNVTNNTIKYNDDYGVKLYDSTGNYVYENKFTDNNVTHKGHQAWDNGATNTNHWNTTEKGNWWSDWVNNSGFPCNYTIDGGSNKDYKPTGPYHVYNFSCGAGTDKWAYGENVATRPPGTNDVPDTEFDTDGYGNIEADDGTFQSGVSAGGPNARYAAHRFKFTIAEPVSSITEINVTWNGKGWHDDGSDYNGSELYIWNFTSGQYGSWQDDDDSGDEVYLTKEITSGFNNHIDSSGTMMVLVVQMSARSGGDNSHIETDYVGVAVCATP